MSDDTFHKMVSAPEIQGQWEPKDCDLVLYNGHLRDYSSWMWRQDCIWLPSEKDLRGMLPHNEGRYYSLGWGADEQGVVRHKLNIYQWQKIQETFYGTAREALVQGVMHEHSKRWDGERWIE